MTDQPAHPLTGLKVVELARILAGPWAGQIFADLGAEVAVGRRPLAGWQPGVALTLTPRRGRRAAG